GLHAGLDLAGPADEERRADAAFGGGEVRTVEEAAGAATREMILGAVIAAEDDDGVLADAELIDLVEQHAEIVIEHQQAVAPFAVLALPLEFGTGDHRKVHHRMIEVEEERLLLLHRAFHEGGAALQVLEVHVLLHLDRELLRLDRLAGP